MSHPSGTVIISGGGTGGHFYPALAIAGFLRDSGYDVRYIGAKRGIEAEKLAKAPFPCYFLNAFGWNRKFLTIFKSIFFLVYNIFLSAMIIRKADPEFVIITGGYASLSSGLAAAILGRKLYIQEQNAFPGLTNRILYFAAAKIFLGFPLSAFPFPFNLHSAASKLILSFNPVRPEFQEGPFERPKHVFFVGGSQGSQAINDIFLRSKEILLSRGYSITLACGIRYYDAFKSQACDKITVKPYSEKIWEDLRSCRFVVSRCGASSLAELIRTSTVSVLVPYRISANNHQWHNAQVLERRMAAISVDESELDKIDWISLFNGLESRYNEYAKNIAALRMKSLDRDFFQVFVEILGLKP
ncbi:MAG: UDP-N-acetylglucosamine--N-acetylmuramyl-(pentapeptide) pyrophosphoryl-undecaprenol N-acetylglucosamine transferase [Candidatus Wallbacteria bacterium]|nr:UDP-N-acetylglucosamine--N-acetylmuramyl-(pentapeptide) pyrophosphoryl-undecaprenol N-acetylglucosamine transferase [Candidatus Wallbacteria bacterium]